VDTVPNEWQYRVHLNGRICACGQQILCKGMADQNVLGWQTLSRMLSIAFEDDGRIFYYKVYMGLLQSGMAKYCSKRQLDRLWQIIIPEDKSIY
jgi:hypothetical protein